VTGLTREHLETFVFDPHRAIETEVQAMAAELLELRASKARPPLGHLVVAKRDKSASAVGPVWSDRGKAEQLMARVSGDREKHPGIWHGAEFVLAEVREERS
jgi:hypothetical protein